MCIFLARTNSAIASQIPNSDYLECRPAITVHLLTTTNVLEEAPEVCCSDGSQAH